MALSEFSTSTSLRLVLTRWHIAATNRSVCNGEFLWKSLLLQQNFVAATSRTNSVLFDFLQLVAATKFCCIDKYFQKNSPVHRKRFVAATCRLTVLLKLVAWHVHLEWSVTTTCCCNLSPSVYRPLLKCYSFSQQSFHQTKSGRNKTTQKSCKSEVPSVTNISFFS